MNDGSSFGSECNFIIRIPTELIFGMGGEQS
jgi:hypothetical protein